MSDIERRIANLSPEKRALLTKKLQQKQNVNLSAPKIERRQDASSYPLSFAQQRMWFLNQWEPDNPFYNITSFVRILGNLDINALEGSIDKVIERHAILRSRFLTDKGLPKQVIDDDQVFNLPVIDLSSLKEDEFGDRLKLLMDAEAKKGFDLVEGPLLRAKLVRFSSENHVLFLSMHHIISDGWSMRVFITEVLLLYEAFTTKKPITLVDLPIQYFDYAEWQKQHLTDEVLETQLNFWKQQIGDPNQVLDLPTDKPRPEMLTQNGSVFRFDIPPELSAKIKPFTRKHEISSFMFFLAVFQIMLYRYSAQEEIRVGIPVANRPVPELETIMGMFVNTLVINGQFSDATTAEEFFSQTKESVLNAFSHQDLPLETLIEELDVIRDLRYSPLFQVMFAYQENLTKELYTKELKLEIMDFDSKSSKFDITLFIEESGDEYTGIIEYNTDIFYEETIKRMAAHFRVLLESIIENSSTRISHLPLLTLEEEHKQILDWNDTQTSYPVESTIVELFHKQANMNPQIIAAEFHDQNGLIARSTYSELDEKSNRIAQLLVNNGISSNDIVSIFMERSMLMIEATLGIIKAGGAYLPIDTGYPIERVRFMVNDGQTPVLLTSQKYVNDIDKIFNTEIEGYDFLQKTQVIYLDSEKTKSSLFGKSPHFQGQRSSSSDLAYVMYTSGSTGNPKGVSIPQRAIVRLLFNTNYLSVPPGSRFAHASNPSFDAATLEIWGALLHGCTLVGVSKEIALTTHQYSKFLRDNKITHLFLTPALFNNIVKEEPDAFRTLDHLMVGGEQMDMHTARILMHSNPPKRFTNVYGPTESTTFTTWHDVSLQDVEQRKTIIPIGKPISNTTTFVLDQNLRPVPVGVTGELFIGGDGLARGYHNQPEMTSESFIQNPYIDLLIDRLDYRANETRLYKTGDLVRYLPDGDIVFLGRNDFQIKLRGLRIELGEIENVISEYPGISDQVVVVREDVPGEKRIIGYLVQDDENEVDLSDLRAYLNSKLPEYMVPIAFVLLDFLPINQNGKVDRKRLPKPDLTDIIIQSNYIAPRNELESTLCDIWEGLLGINNIGVADNFFALGGHSLLVTQLASRIRSEYDIEVKVRSIFEHPTIEELSVIIKDQQKLGHLYHEEPITNIQDRTNLELSYAQQRLWFLDNLNPESPEYNVPFAIRVKGMLDTQFLLKSIEDVTIRHEILRSRIATRNGRPIVEIIEQASPDFRIVDLVETTSGEREMTIDHLVQKEIQSTFNLERDTLIRVTVIKIQPEEFILLFVVHHIVADGWSLMIFFNEISIQYANYQLNKAQSFEPLEIQFYDYASWQKQRLKGEFVEEGIQFWKRYLDDIPAILELPTSYVRPAINSGKGRQIKFQIEKGISEDIRRLVMNSDVTHYMFFLTAFYILLNRYSQQDDIVIGSPVTNRNHVSLENLIGFFVNTIAIRVDQGDDLSVIDLLNQVKESALNAFSHSELPFEMVIQALQPERDLSVTPIFQVMFGYQEPFDFASGFVESGMELEQYHLDAGTSKFDLTLTIADNGSEFIGNLEYRVDLFSPGFMENFVSHLQSIISLITQHPKEKFKQLRYLTSIEEHKMLFEYNRNELPIAHRETVVSLFNSQAHKSPKQIAVIAGMGDQRNEINYSDLLRRSNKLAHFLKNNGVSKGQIIGLFCERSIEMIIGLLGILKSGCAYVPLDPMYPHERLKLILNDIQEANKSNPFVLSQSGLNSLLPDNQYRIINLDSDWKDIENESEINPEITITSEDLVYVLYTSGSTGLPKGVMIEHHNLVNLWIGMRHLVDYGSDDGGSRFSLNAPLLFDASVEQWIMLLSGETIVIVPQEIRMDGKKMISWIEENQIDVLDCVPSQLKLMIDEGLLDTVDKYRPRVVMPGGEAITQEIWSVLVESRMTDFYNLYGPTECSVNSAICKVKDHPKSPVIGKGMINTYLYVLDANFQIVPTGVPGELYISGEAVGRGYLNKPDLTNEKFLPDPFRPGLRMYRTGDRVRWLESGMVEFLGRLDNQVKLRGFRLELGDIETALHKIDGIAEGVVILREDRPGIKQLVAYIKIREETELTLTQIREQLKNVLPDYMVPAIFMELDVFPLTSSGKINRRALPKPDENLLTSNETHVAPETNEEEALSKIWGEILHLENISVNSNFFELGGDSILAIQVVSKANQAGLVFSVRDLFEAQTVRELARRVENKSLVEAEQGLVTGKANLSPIQKWFFDQNFTEFWHWNQAVLFGVKEELDEFTLIESVRILTDHHDVLRAKFSMEISGTWTFEFREKNDFTPVRTFELGDVSEIEVDNFVQSKIKEFQEGINLTDGPLFWVIYFKTGEMKPDLLFIVIHHLIIDGISWRILLEDLELVYTALMQRNEPILPPKTTSFKEWTENLVNFSKTFDFEDEKSYWKRIATFNIRSLPCDFPPSNNLRKFTKQVRIEFSPGETEQITRDIIQSTGAGINNIFLMALALAYHEWSGDHQLLLEMEGHGRSDILEGMNPYRTMGWFTTMYPVLLRLSAEGTYSEHLAEITRQMNQIPNDGFTYGILRYLQGSGDEFPVIRPEISFNYLGQIHSSANDSRLFTLVSQNVGKSMSPLSHRSHLIEIIGSILNGVLQFEWHFSENIHRSDNIEHFSQLFKKNLINMISGFEVDHQDALPIDFLTDVNLDNEELDQIFDELGDM